jgi:hypothetical protein
MLMYKDERLDILPVEEPKYMPTANRRRWMRDYMEEYRKGKRRGDMVECHSRSARGEDLKMAHRFESFKWRFSNY